MRKLIIALPLMLAITASANAGTSWKEKRATRNAERLERALAGKTPGKPLHCISLRDAEGPESVGDSTLLFRVSRTLVYRNETRGSCGRIGNGAALVTRTWSGQLCRGDIAHATDLRHGFIEGSCAMGDFIPYKGS